MANLHTSFIISGRPPANVLKKAHEVMQHLWAKQVRPKRLTCNGGTVVRVGRRWRLLSCGKGKPYRLMSHEKYNKEIMK